MTWLTPWPFGGDPDILSANPEMRLFGVSLGLAAIGGAVLTIGLIRPWGEVFPRWLPVLRGRTLPTALPTAIGMAVGGTVTVAGRSFVQLVAAQPDTWPMLLIFPFPLWAPLLIAASAAYYLRRRPPCPTCGQASPGTPAILKSHCRIWTLDFQDRGGGRREAAAVHPLFGDGWPSISVGIPVGRLAREHGDTHT